MAGAGASEGGGEVVVAGGGVVVKAGGGGGVTVGRLATCVMELNEKSAAIFMPAPSSYSDDPEVQFWT